MSEQSFGAVTALEFRVSPEQGFEDIVEEFDIAFRPLGLTRRSLIWDGEDIAIIERDSIRIVLGWLAPDHPGARSFLILAIGNAPNHRGATLDLNTCSMLSTLLLNHAKGYLPVSSVLHADATQPVGTELIDMICELLRHDGPYSDAPADDMQNPPNQEFDTAPDPADPAMDFAMFGQSQDRAGTADILDAEYVDLDRAQELSLPKRLTIYTLGATMLLYTPPVGATLLVYTTLRDFAPEHPPWLERPAA